MLIYNVAKVTHTDAYTHTHINRLSRSHGPGTKKQMGVVSKVITLLTTNGSSSIRSDVVVTSDVACG